MSKRTYSSSSINCFYCIAWACWILAVALCLPDTVPSSCLILIWCRCCTDHTWLPPAHPLLFHLGEHAGLILSLLSIQQRWRYMPPPCRTWPWLPRARWDVFGVATMTHELPETLPHCIFAAVIVAYESMVNQHYHSPTVSLIPVTFPHPLVPDTDSLGFNDHNNHHHHLGRTIRPPWPNSP